MVKPAIKGRPTMTNWETAENRANEIDLQIIETLDRGDSFRVGESLSGLKKRNERYYKKKDIRLLASHIPIVR